MTRKDKLPKESNRGPQEKYLRSSLLSYSGKGGRLPLPLPLVELPAPLGVELVRGVGTRCECPHQGCVEGVIGWQE